MGYSHYWYRPWVLPEIPFGRWAVDVAKIYAEATRIGLKLDDEDMTLEAVTFNGARHCGHARNDRLVIPWPARGAKGVSDDASEAISGTWYAGAEIAARTCGGDCSYETFLLERQLKRPGPTDSSGRFFECCKTAYRPYDLVVTAALLMAKHRFGDALFGVATDGDIENWYEGQQLALMATRVLPALTEATIGLDVVA